jgi:hypothetical protein
MDFDELREIEKLYDIEEILWIFSKLFAVSFLDKN